MSDKAYPVAPEWASRAWLDDAKYQALYARSVADPEGFWGESGRRIDWIRPYTKVKNTSFDTHNVSIKWFEDGTLNVSANCIDRHLATRGDQIAIIWEGDDPTHEETITYRQLHERVSRFANVLKAHGVKKGDTVTIYLPMIPEAAYAMLACARIGAIHSVVFGGFSPDSLAGRIEDAASRFIITADEGVRGGKPVPLKKNTDAALAKVGKGNETVLVVRRTGGPVPWTAGRDVWLHDEVGKVSADCPPVEVGAEDPLFILYTSGSTGKPKGVVLTQDALACNALNSAAMHDMTPEDRILTTLPLFHVGGLNILTLPALHAGATVTLHPKFDPGATLEAIERERITLTVLVPAQIAALAAHPRWSQADLGSLRMITTGSQIVPPRDYERVHARGVPLVSVYGSTETAPIATYVRAAEARRKAGSAGRAAPHCECRVVDAAGNDVPAAASGEIVVRGPNVMAGYWGDPAASEAALRDGWFHTGDVGHFDDEGWLTVDGRIKDMIISGGENVYPAEIENVLAEHDAIAEVAVVGRPDERWGEAVVAVVVPKAGRRLEAHEVLALLEGRVARYKHPRAVIFVDALPRTALGKVQKADVREIAMDAARKGAMA